VARRVTWLDVRRVEVAGTRFVAPHEIMERSGIRDGQNLLDEGSLWIAALLEHPAVAGATIIRKPPHTLRIRIEEKRPVAFVNDGTLRIVDGSGGFLPFEPDRVSVDLPIVHGSLADAAEGGVVRMILAETDRLTQIDPILMGEVSEIRRSSVGDGVMLLTHRSAEVILPVGATAGRLAELRAVIADVEQRFPADSMATSSRLPRLDLRFGDQIVVRPQTSDEIL